MTVRELREALPYGADDAEVLIAPGACVYGNECAATSVLDGSNNRRKCIIIVAKQREEYAMREEKTINE